MTPDDLNAIRDRAEASTKGPWEARQLPTTVGLHTHTIHSEHGTTGTWTADIPPEVGALHTDSDAMFIAHAREDIPKLLDALELQTRLAKMGRELKIERDQLADQIAATLALIDEFEEEDIMPVGQVTLLRRALKRPEFFGGAG